MQLISIFFTILIIISILFTLVILVILSILSGIFFFLFFFTARSYITRLLPRFTTLCRLMGNM